MSTPDAMRTRVTRIVEKLAAQTAADAIEWERAAIADSYGVTIGAVRFRVRSAAGDREAPYILEFLGEGANIGPIMTASTIESTQDRLIVNLYLAARASAWANTPDPLLSVELQLGISESDDG
jgi:hypothetical protein